MGVSFPLLTLRKNNGDHVTRLRMARGGLAHDHHKNTDMILNGPLLSSARPKCREGKMILAV